MSLVRYEVENQVAVVTWANGENRFNPDFLDAHIRAMKEIEATTDAAVAVVLSADKKIWSNGIDLDWLAPHIFENHRPVVKEFFFRINDFFKCQLTSPLVTIACINGHAFAGGCMAACSFDYRFMQTGRGFICVPEIDLGMRFMPGMMALLRKAIPPDTLVDMALGGIRLTAEQAREAGIVKEAHPPEELREKTLEFARTRIKQRHVVQAIKRDMYSPCLNVLEREDPAVINAGGWTI